MRGEAKEGFGLGNRVGCWCTSLTVTPLRGGCRGGGRGEGTVGRGIEELRLRKVEFHEPVSCPNVILQ